MISSRSVLGSRTVSRASTVTVRAANLVDTAKAKGFTSFVAAVEKAGLTKALSDPSATYTIFVPTNAAFSAYDARDPHTGAPIPIADTLMYHVVKGKTQGRHIANTPKIKNLADPKYGGSMGPVIQVDVRTKKGAMLLGSPAQGTQGLAGSPIGGFVVEQDILADNGIIHVVDGVFKPQLPLPGNNGSGSAGAAAAW